MPATVRGGDKGRSGQVPSCLSLPLCGALCVQCSCESVRMVRTRVRMLPRVGVTKFSLDDITRRMFPGCENVLLWALPGLQTEYSCRCCVSGRWPKQVSKVRRDAETDNTYTHRYCRVVEGSGTCYSLFTRPEVGGSRVCVWYCRSMRDVHEPRRKAKRLTRDIR